MYNTRHRGVGPPAADIISPLIKNEIHDRHPPWNRSRHDSLIGHVHSDAETSQNIFFTFSSSHATESMCGIVAVHGIANPASERAKYIAYSKKIRHRGPDWSGCYVGSRSILVHERLAIVGVGECIFPHTRCVAN